MKNNAQQVFWYNLLFVAANLQPRTERLLDDESRVVEKRSIDNDRRRVEKSIQIEKQGKT